MRAGYTPRFRELLQAADPVLHLIAELVQVNSSDIKDIESEWSNADSLSGFTSLPSGGVMLNAASSAVAEQTSDDGTQITQITSVPPFSALLIKWTSYDAEHVELKNLTAHLNPRADGGQPSTVYEWRARLYRVMQVGPDYSAGPKADRIEVAPISKVAQVAAAGSSAYDVTFDFSTDSGYPIVGPPPEYIGTGQRGPTRPQTLVRIWAVKSDGSPADNVAWMADSTLGSTWSGVGIDTTHLVLDEDPTTYGYGAEQGANTVFHIASFSGGSTPRFTINKATYAAATVSFTGSTRIQGLGTTGSQEVIASGQEPADSSIMFEISPAGADSWTECFDGDIIGEDNTAKGGADLSGLTPSAAWDMRATLTPSSTALSAPIARRLGVREVVSTDLVGVATVNGGRWQVDPRTLKGNITKAEIHILKTGEQDFRDYGSEILAKHHIGDVEVRVWVGDPTGVYLPRKRWMHIDSFEIEDYESTQTAHVITGISPLRRLRKKVPPFVVTSANDGTREPVVYANETIKAAAADVIDNLIGLPGRFRGPGVPDTTTVTKTIRDSDAKDELDRLAYLAGYGIITSEGRVKAVPMMRDGTGAASPVAFFPIGSYTPVYIGPGFATRVDEFFVPYGWSEDVGEFDAEVRYFNATAVEKLGGSGLETTDRLADETAKWVSSIEHATAVAKRVPNHFGNGLIIWKIRSTYAHPELEPGDPVVIVTNQFVARSPITDREIRGPIAALGVVSAVGDFWGHALEIWIPSFDDIVLDGGDVDLVGFGRPEIQDAVVTFDKDGAATAQVRTTRAAGSVKLVTDDAAFQGRATVQAQTSDAVDSDGYGTADLGGAWELGQTLNLTGLAYTGGAGDGTESFALYKRSFPVTFEEPRVIATLDLDGSDLYLTWQSLGAVTQVRWAADGATAPDLAAVQASSDVDTTGRVLVYSFDASDVTPQTAYVGFLGESASALALTSLLSRSFPFQAVNLPRVKLVYLGRTTDGDEKWLAVATVAGNNVALYLRTYDKGSTPPSYNRHPSSGYSSDPYAYPFTFAHPADGDPNVVIEAYAEDDSATPITGPVEYAESDSDTLPTVDVSLDIDADNEIYAIPKRIDTDALSYRFRVAVGAKGSAAYSDPAFGATGTDEFSGTSWGTPVKLSAILSAISALKDDEELFISGYGFNTSSTSSAAQSNAVRSANMRASIPAGAVRNSLRGAALRWVQTQQSVPPGVIYSVFTLYADLQRMTDAVASVHWAAASSSYSDSGNANLSDDGEVQLTSAGLFASWPAGESITVTFTPYDATGGSGGSGHAGPVTKVTIESWSVTPVGARAEDTASVGTIVSGDRYIIADGLALDQDSNARPRLKLKATKSTSDPSGTPEDGEIWLKYTP